jgi:predicted methyltransferase
MVIAELKSHCAECKGTGQLAAFEELGINQINPRKHCPYCQGRGFHLTELGQDVLKTLRPFIVELVDERLGARGSKPAGAGP